MNIKFSYYYGKEADQYSFFKIPKILYTDSIFKTLSSDAKVLYAILLDRMSLSMKNGWLDEENKVFIIFTIDEIEETMNIGRNKAINIMKEIQDFGLIEKKRRGLGKPNIIYVKSFLVETKEENRTAEEETSEDRSLNVKFQEVSKANLQKFEKQTSRNLENKPQEVSKTNCNKTNTNKTEYSNTDFNHTSPRSSSKTSGINHQEQDPEVEETIQTLKQNIEYLSLIEERAEEKETIDLMLNLMTEVIKNKTDRRINQSRIPFERLKEQLLTLKKEHIDYVLLVLSENKNKISNLRAYLLSLLYNASVNILGMKKHQEPDTTDYSKDQQIWRAFFDTT
ncbi:replication initiator protein A, N-terminal domain protein [Eubacterium nodatum ATCC 33099]|nr:replication initiator protein A, N-terminal domain protein [Eubacterium nodatum ATCC 33099]